MDPDFSFKLSRPARGEACSIFARASTVTDALRSSVISIEVRTLPALAPHRTYLESPVASFLAERDCAIKAIVWEGQAPNRLVRVDWDIPTKPEAKGRFGQVEILPDAGWF